LVQLQGITASQIDSADAQIVLELVKDFTSVILGMLGNLRTKYNFDNFKSLNMVPFIHNQARTLDNGVTELMGILKNALPVCNFPYHMKLDATDE
jgi:hypothetical protein